nr:septation ring formation regulator EzrA [Brevibacillus sp. SYP-B805]
MLLCMASLLCFSTPAGAVPFPEKTDEVVQDKDGYLPADDHEHFAQFVKEFPNAYKLVVVESTQPEAQTADEYAQKLYDNYNLSDDTLMIVLDIDTQQLGVYPGPALQQKGANLEMLHEKITSYYEPFRNQKEYIKGIELFISEVNAELSRMGKKNGPAGSTAAADPAKAPQPAETAEKSLWLSLPWWLYLMGLLFAALLAALLYSYFRRRHVFAQVDDVEDWKDELVEKLQMIEVDKSLRRSSGTTEERYVELANRKENIMRMRVPDVEMIILEAEEACDRFRFQMALGLLDEARELLTEIEQEMAELKADVAKVVQTKKENKAVLPEIGKLVETAERKLSHARLEYGLPFHELKVKLDDVEAMRGTVKEALAMGDDVKAHETTLKAQAILNGMLSDLEQIPGLVKTVQMELPEELKEMEEGIAAVIDGGYELSQDQLDTAMLQAKQLLTAARNALEEGSLELVRTHVKAFRVQMDAMFQSIEQSVMQQRELAAQAKQPVQEKEGLPMQPVQAAMADEEGEPDELPEHPYEPEPAEEPEQEQRVEPFDVQEESRLAMAEAAIAGEAAAAMDAPGKPKEGADRSALSVEEREELGITAKAAHPEDAEPREEEEVEYELVIPKQPAAAVEHEQPPRQLVVETEDDVLNELERISGILMRVRQQIKRSYLPGIPDQLKYLFDRSVQLLGQIKAALEQYRYEMDEVAALLQEAHEFVHETEKMAEKVIESCQKAEGAIQYTNRYRRQNRQVNELLQKAEQAFRQLAFQEAYQMAEEARLLVEGEREEPDGRWMLRRKKKG